MVADNEKYILSSVDNALNVLNLFFVHEELTATQIAKILGTNRSSVFRFLVTLENRGYLSKDKHSRYRLGIKMFTLGQLAKSRMELNRLVHPYLEKISESTVETSHLVILEGNEAVFTDRVTGTATLRLDTPPGSSYRAHISGGGKAILAYSDDDRIDQYCNDADFRRNTDRTICSAEELKNELQNIRKNGYAIDEEEAEVGLTCIAVPILDEQSKAIGAISVSGPTTRILAEKDHTIALLKDTVAALTENLIKDSQEIQ
jgi:DNA-binding IclR family transcriptional regulator